MGTFPITSWIHDLKSFQEAFHLNLKLAENIDEMTAFVCFLQVAWLVIMK